MVHRNGGDAQWADARRIWQKVLGYGDWFGIIEERVMDVGAEETEVTVHTLIEMKTSAIEQ